MGRMDEVSESRQSDSFIVRVFRSAGGELSGLVQHVRTGDKIRFQDLASLGQAITAMSRRMAKASYRPESEADGQ